MLQIVRDDNVEGMQFVGEGILVHPELGVSIVLTFVEYGGKTGTKSAVFDLHQNQGVDGSAPRR